MGDRRPKTETESIERRLVLAADLLATVDLDGRFTSLNEAWERLLGWTREELMSRPAVEFVHPDDVSATLRAQATGRLPDYEIAGFENRYQVKGGGWRWLRWYARTDGVGWIAVAFDITESRNRHDELLRALAQGRLCAYSQPIATRGEERVRAEELLARLAATEPGRDPVPAADFIATAEESGLIVDIDVFMINEALRVAGPERRVHVNLSARTIADASGRDRIIDAVVANPAAARNILIEVTESAALDDIEAAAEFGSRLVEHGVRLALDDFGTRFSSLTHLQRLPVHTLKIDNSFVRDLVDDAVSQRLVRSIIAIARELDLETVAEGVETPEALELLQSYGIDAAQGFYLGRPQPLAA